jgi:hypothetical protein
MGPLCTYYLVHPVRAVLMDLGGTSVHRKNFWAWIIQQSMAPLLKKPRKGCLLINIPNTRNEPQ